MWAFVKSVYKCRVVFHSLNEYPAFEINTLDCHWLLLTNFKISISSVKFLWIFRLRFRFKQARRLWNRCLTKLLKISVNGARYALVWDIYNMFKKRFENRIIFEEISMFKNSKYRLLFLVTTVRRELRQHMREEHPRTRKTGAKRKTTSPEPIGIHFSNVTL